MDFASAFKTLQDINNATKGLRQARVNRRGHNRAVLIEIQNNLGLLHLVLEGTIQPQQAIPKLVSTAYQQAVSSGHKLNTLRRSKLSEETIRNVPQFRRYIGWSTQKLIDNIYYKINQLKVILEIGDLKKISLPTRCSNLRKQMILLSSHLQQ